MLFRLREILYDLDMGKQKTLRDEYRFPGFRPKAQLCGIFGDPRARIIRLERTQKKRCAEGAVGGIGASTTECDAGFGIFRAGMFGSIWMWRSVE